MQKDTASTALDIVIRYLNEDGSDDYASAIAMLEALSVEAERTDDEDVTRNLEWMRRRLAEEQERSRVIAEREANPRSVERLLEDCANEALQPMSDAEADTWDAITVEQRRAAKFEAAVKQRVREMTSGRWETFPGGFMQWFDDTPDPSQVYAEANRRRKAKD